MSAPETLRLVCAWCQLVLREGTPSARISHGICAACERRLLLREVEAER